MINKPMLTKGVTCFKDKLDDLFRADEPNDEFNGRIYWIYWFPHSPIPKKIPKIILPLFSHFHIFDLVLDPKWGTKKMVRNLFLKNYNQN